jgi:hypothetical protein
MIYQASPAERKQNFNYTAGDLACANQTGNEIAGSSNLC